MVENIAIAIVSIWRRNKYMKFIKFDTTWSTKHKIFENVDVDLNLNGDDLRSKKYLIKFNISIFPTFIYATENDKLVGKLENPYDIEEFLEWKNRCISIKISTS